MTAALLGVPAAVPAAMQRLFRLVAIATIVLGCAAMVGGAAVVMSGVHLLQTRDLGLGGVGLVIGLILLCALLVLPGVVYLALAWPARRGRAWAFRSAIAIASLHLLLALFVGLGAMSGGEPLAALMVGAVAALLTGYLGCLLRCLAAAKALEPSPAGLSRSQSGRGGRLSPQRLGEVFRGQGEPRHEAAEEDRDRGAGAETSGEDVGDAADQHRLA